MADVSSAPNKIRTMIPVSSDIEWDSFKAQIASILNVFPANLHPQYTLSSEKANTIPISLNSETELDALNRRLRPLFLPRRAKKEINVLITNKDDDKFSEANSSKGKVSLLVSLIIHLAH